MAKRLIGLDLLRFLAVVLVVAAHLAMIPSGPRWVGWFTRHGSLGVSLFFVLSGFLVAGLLFAEHRTRGSISVGRFYTRRAWKIYPPFYLMLTFTYLYVRFGIGWKMPDSMIFREMLFIQNYCSAYWNHTWSLAVEEHFYIALPLLLWAFQRANRLAVNPFRFLPPLIAGVLVVEFVSRLINFVCIPYGERTHQFPTHLRLDGLFFGVLLAYLYHYRSFSPLRPWRYALIAVGSLVAATPPYICNGMDLYYNTLGFTQEYLGSGAVLTGVMLCEIPRTRITGLLATLGSYSYSIYLWHMAAIFWVTPYIDAPWGVSAAYYLIAAFTLGIAAAWAWELPTLKIRDRYFPSMLRKAA